MNNNFNETEFKSLLINRNEIEKALDVAINLNKDDCDLCFEDYSMFPELPLHDVVSIFLNYHPENWNVERHPRYSVITKAIEAIARKENKPNGIRIEQEFDINGNETLFNIYLSHEFARAWAETHGLNWNVPPYKSVISDVANNSQIEQLQAELQQARNQIAQLQQENAQLLNQKQSEVNYEDCSIYGHSSEEIKIMFKAIEKFWKNCDLNQPDTIANKEIIIDWIISKYGKNKSTAERIQTLIRPEKARETGRKS